MDETTRVVSNCYYYCCSCYKRQAVFDANRSTRNPAVCVNYICKAAGVEWLDNHTALCFIGPKNTVFEETTKTRFECRSRLYEW